MFAFSYFLTGRKTGRPARGGGFFFNKKNKDHAFNFSFLFCGRKRGLDFFESKINFNVEALYLYRLLNK